MGGILRVKRSPVSTAASLVLLSMACLPVVSCSTVELGRARGLAAAGADSSSTLVGASSKITNDFADERDAEDLQDALLDVPAGTRSPDVDNVLAQLRSRSAVALTLQTSYSAFAALAGYDASAEFAQSASALFDAVDAAGTAAALSNKTERAALGQFGGELVAVDQARRLRRASLALSSALQTYLDILSASSPGFISIERHAVAGHYQAVTALWGAQFLDGTKLLSTLQTEDGLTLVAKGDFTSHNPLVDRIVRRVLSRREERAEAGIAAVDQANRDLLSALIKKHHQFEAGQPLNLSEIQSLVNAIANSSSTIAQSKGK